MITWDNVKQDVSWTSLYWHWPIKTGDGTRYERITLIMQDRPGNLFTAPTVDPTVSTRLAEEIAPPDPTTGPTTRRTSFG